MEVLKVSSKSKPASVAGAIVKQLEMENKSVLQCVGAGAVNQAVKSVAIARGYITPLGYDLHMVPAFCTVEVPDSPEPVSGVKLIISKVW